jgi:hypothetical protein
MSLQQQIIDEWREDADMGDDLFNAARNIPILHSKWIDKYLRIQLLKKEKEYEYKKVYKQKYSYYMGREEDAPDEKIMKTEVQIYIDADEEIIKLKAMVDLYDKLESTLKEILNNINNRSFQIKNAIDWLRYSRGIDE